MMDNLRYIHIMDMGGISIPVLFTYMNCVDYRVCWVSYYI